MNSLYKSIIVNELEKLKLQVLNEASNFSGTVDDENPNEIVWDDIEQSIEKTLEGVNSLEKVKYYLTMLHQKFKGLPVNIRRKIYGIAIIAMSAVMLANVDDTNDEVLCDLEPDLRAEILVLDNPVINKVKDECGGLNGTKMNVRKVSDSLVNFLKLEEGSARHKGKPVLIAYEIGDGMVTIGWGHAERKSRTKMIPGKTTITLAQAESLLDRDIKKASNALNRILNKWDKRGLDVQVTQGMYDSMVSMIFNMGIGNFRKSQFIKLVKANELDKAKEYIKRTAISYSGHVPRRKKESEMFSIP